MKNNKNLTKYYLKLLNLLITGSLSDWKSDIDPLSVGLASVNNKQKQALL